MSPGKRDERPARELSAEQAAAAAMVAEARERGLALTGPDGLLKLFTKNVLETALNEEMTEHLGHEKNRAESGRESANVRNGTRKKTGSYHPWWAHNRAWQRRRRPKPVKLIANPGLRILVQAKLKTKWSPQQIARFLARTTAGDRTHRVCAETVYRALFAGLLGKKDGRLRTGRSYRKPQRRGAGPRNDIPNIRPLAHRPASANDRTQPGHWEGDLIIGRGQRSAIATLVERTSRFVVLVALPDGHKAPRVRDALVTALNLLPAPMRKTLTWDRGRELFWHEQITAATGTQIYFADAHAPWQRGTNENTNGLLRQYLPKHTDLRAHDNRALARIARELNQRPRLILADRTPEEVMADCLTTTTNH